MSNLQGASQWTINIRAGYWAAHIFLQTSSHWKSEELVLLWCLQKNPPNPPTSVILFSQVNKCSLVPKKEKPCPITAKQNICKAFFEEPHSLLRNCFKVVSRTSARSTVLIMCHSSTEDTLQGWRSLVAENFRIKTAIQTDKRWFYHPKYKWKFLTSTK